MSEAKRLRILFIGNSHTYVHDVPEIVARHAREAGYDCEVTMIAHGGWFLAQHVEEPDVRFNICYGHYDYVVLQEHSHPFSPEEKYAGAVKTLAGWAHEAGSRPVIYATWAMKAEPEVQAMMNEVNSRIAKENKALLAPVGESWWQYMAANPDLDLYYQDGAHASIHGSEYAAQVIWNTICSDLEN